MRPSLLDPFNLSKIEKLIGLNNLDCMIFLNYSLEWGQIVEVCSGVGLYFVCVKERLGCILFVKLFLDYTLQARRGNHNRVRFLFSLRKNCRSQIRKCWKHMTWLFFNIFVFQNIALLFDKFFLKNNHLLSLLFILSIWFV